MRTMAIHTARRSVAVAGSVSGTARFGRRRLPTRKDKVERPGAHVPVAQLVLWYLEVDAPLDGFPQETKFVTQAPDFIQQIIIIVVLAVADVL